MNYPNQYMDLCLEGSSSVFKGLNQKDKETIAQHHSTAVVNRGGFLFTEGEKTRGLIYLVAGKVKIFKEGVGESEQILRMIKPRRYNRLQDFILRKHMVSISKGN